MNHLYGISAFVNFFIKWVSWNCNKLIKHIPVLNMFIIICFTNFVWPHFFFTLDVLLVTKVFLQCHTWNAISLSTQENGLTPVHIVDEDIINAVMSHCISRKIGAARHQTGRRRQKLQGKGNLRQRKTRKKLYCLMLSWYQKQLLSVEMM